MIGPYLSRTDTVLLLCTSILAKHLVSFLIKIPYLPGPTFLLVHEEICYCGYKTFSPVEPTAQKVGTLYKKLSDQRPLRNGASATRFFVAQLAKGEVVWGRRWYRWIGRFRHRTCRFDTIPGCDGHKDGQLNDGSAYCIVC